MFSRLKFPLFENEKRTSVCWLNTLSIATHEKLVRTLRPSTRRPSDCLSRILGPETYANYRTSSSDPSSCAKPRIFRWMKAGFPKVLFRPHLALQNREPSRLRLSRAASERLLRQCWPKQEDGFPVRRERQLSLEFHHPLLRPASRP